MPAWGLSETGWYRPPFTEVRTTLETRWKGRFGANRNTRHDSVDGHIIDFTAEVVALILEAAEGAYNASFLDTAWGIALDLWAAGHGFVRREARATTVDAYLYGTAATVISGTSVVKTSDAGDRFVPSAAVTLGTTDHAYVVEIVDGINTDTYTVTIDGNAHAHVAASTDAEAIRDALITAVNAGPTAAVAQSAGTRTGGGPALLITGVTGLTTTATATDTDAIALHRAEVVEMSSEVLDQIAADALSLDTIVTPVTGWAGVINIADAFEGEAEELDIELKTRIRLAIQTGGIKAALLRIDGVEAVTIFQNDTDVPDAIYGTTHWVEALVVGGEPQAIVNVLWDAKAKGIGTEGDTELAESVTGDSNLVRFSRGDEIEIWVDVEITAGENFPTTAAAVLAIRTALVDWANANHAHGDDVAPDQLRGQIAALYSGKFSAVVRVEDVNPPVNTGMFAVSDRDIARFALARMAVTIS